MSLFAALNLQPPRALAEFVAQHSAIERLRQELAAAVKRGINEASVLPSRDAKAELAAALVAAEKLRAAAEQLPDAKDKAAALREARDRAVAAVAKVAPKSKGAAVPSDADASAPAGADPAPSAAAAGARKLRDQIAADLLQARMACAPIAKDAEILAEKLKAATGSEKAQFQKRKAVVDTQLAAAHAAIKQADADLKALDDPRSDDPVFHAILARRGSTASATVVRETDQHDDPLEKALASRKETKTATALADGQAVQTTRTQTEGLTKDGLGSKTETSSTTVTGDTKQTTTRTSTQSTQLNLGGLTIDGKQTQDSEKDGRKTGVEKSASANVGLGGLTTTSTSKTTNADKSTSESKQTGTLERNDGKLTGGAATTKTNESASGTKTTNTGTTKAGLVAGKDGLGLTGESDRAIDRATKSGLKGGVVAGLSANITCNIVAEENTSPQMYTVVLKVELGGKLGGSAGFEREAGKNEQGRDVPASGSASVSAAAKVTLERQRRYDETGTKAYIEALKTGNGQESEFAIIRAGLTQDWGTARDLYLGLRGKSTSVAEADKLGAGESSKVSSEMSKGGGLKLGGKEGDSSVGVEAGHERSATSSTTVTKGADGKLVYDASRGDGSKTTAGASVKMGVVEGGIKLGWSKTSATGLKIAIDPKAQDAAEMQAELDACKDAEALAAFALKYPATVQERSRTSGEGESQEVSAGVAGVKGALKYGNATETTTTTGADGKLKQKTVTGSASSGGELGLGASLKVSGSSTDKVVATSDGDGKASADITKTDTATNLAKLAEAKLGALAGKTGQGALTQAAGGADTEDKVVGGIKLTHQDLSNLAALACENWAGWVRACGGEGADMKDWVGAGRGIQKAPEKMRAAAAGEALARFVGSNNRDRLEILKAALGRRAGQVGGGAGFEFKGDLVKFKPDYDAYVVEASEGKVDEAKDIDAKRKAAAEVIGKLDALHKSMKNAEFQSPAIRAEMLSTILERKKRVQAALNAAQGKQGEAPSLDEAKARFNDLVANCVNFKDEETKLFKQVHALVSGGGPVAAKNLKFVNELKSLYVIWRKDYEEMATLVGTHKIGGANWSQYRPDDERFQLCHDNKSPFGDARKQEVRALPKDEKDRTQKKPTADEEEAARQARLKSMDDSIKEAKAIQAEIPRLQAQVQALGETLGLMLDKQSKPPAVDLYNKADKLVAAAKEQCNACRRDHVPDLTTLGAAARSKYRQAIGHLQKALAMYPAGKKA